MQKYGIVVCTVAMMTISVASCGKGRFDPAAYQSLLHSGLAVIQPAAQMNAMFKEVDHFVGSHTTGDRRRTWNSEAFVFDRYVLTMQVEVRVTPRNDGIEELTGNPKFRIIEVERVVKSGGSTGAFFGMNRWFGSEEWERIVASGGRFSAAEIEVITDKPISEFAEYRDAIRKDRIKVQ